MNANRCSSEANTHVRAKNGKNVHHMHRYKKVTSQVRSQKNKKNYFNLKNFYTIDKKVSM